VLPRLVHHFDEPFGDSSAIPTYYLSKLARRDVTVALGGDGGDEVFAGYVTYQADKLARLYDRLPGFLTRGLAPALARRLPVSDGKVSLDFKARRFVENALLEPGRRHYAWKAFFADGLKRAVLSGDVLAALDGASDTYHVFGSCYERVRHHDWLNAFLYADTKVYLADDILVKVDRMSMAHSLEVRVPLLDYRVVEYVFGLPGHVKMPGFGLKRLLKRTMRGLLPEGTLRRGKGGFNVPIPVWLKHELRPLLQEYLAPDRLRRQGIFNPTTVSRLVSDHLEGTADYSRNIWALLVFSLWHERQTRRSHVGGSSGNGLALGAVVPEDDPGRQVGCA